MSSLSPKERSRSPRFPSQSLEDSIRHIELIYEGVHRSPIDAETAYRLMGFSGKTGTSAKALGSLRQYGLIEGMGDNTRVSDLALAILEPSSDEEYARSIWKSSREPSVFEALLSRFDDRIPQADEPIRAFLIRELGFQKNSADDLIRTLRESFQFVDSIHASATAEEGQDADHASRAIDPQSAKIEPEAPAQAAAKRPIEGASQTATIPLTRDCHAELNIYGPLTKKAVANLIRAVELLADVWEDDD